MQRSVLLQPKMAVSAHIFFISYENIKAKCILHRFHFYLLGNKCSLSNICCSKCKRDGACSSPFLYTHRGLIKCLAPLAASFPRSGALAAIFRQNPPLLIDFTDRLGVEICYRLRIFKKQKKAIEGWTSCAQGRNADISFRKFSSLVR